MIFRMTAICSLVIALGCGGDEDTLVASDLDGDGFLAPNDCDDLNAEAYPGASELDDGVDQDCDGDPIETDQFDEDDDGYTPGYGSTSDPRPDCDDDNAAINPGASEDYYTALDEDCDLDTNDGDQDGDGFVVALDCDDAASEIYPGASETDDGIDEDCDGDNLELLLFDLDHDGFTAGYGSAELAEPDCNDEDVRTFPGALEIADDGSDNDCSGDGDLEAAAGVGIYVDQQDGSCSDAQAGTIAVPNCTLEGAADLGPGNLFVAEGDYDETRMDYADVVIFGGYDASDWSRDIGSNQTTVLSASMSPAILCIGGNVVLDGLAISGDGSGTLKRTVGVEASGGCHLTVRGSQVTAGHAAAVENAFAHAFGVIVTGGATLEVIDSHLDGGLGTGGYARSRAIMAYQGTILSIERSEIEGGDVEGTSNQSSSVAVLTEAFRTRISDSTITLGESVAPGLEEALGLRIHFNAAGARVERTLFQGGVARDLNHVESSASVELYGNTFDVTGGYRWSVDHSIRELVAVGNVFKGSSSLRLTRGLFVDGGTLTALNNVFAFSSQEHWIGIDTAAGGTIANNVFSATTETTPTAITGVRYVGSVDTLVVANDFYGVINALYETGTLASVSEMDVLNTCAWLGCTEAFGNMVADPQFVDAVSGDFHLQPSSPCIDAGIDPSDYIWGGVPFDIDGESPPNGGTFDIGADEF
jgi:hypothetical protein